jgi:NADH:ubiquinone oxidoreductase subunit 6 (subunit J)
MIYGGNLMSNFAGSMLSKDKEMTKSVILSEVHKLIAKNPAVLIEALTSSGVVVKKGISKNDLIDLVVDNLYSNDSFKEKLAVIISGNTKPKYSNGDGEGDDSEGGGGIPTGAVGAIAGAIGSIFSFGASKTNAKTQAQADKEKLKLALLADDKKKTNWLPIVIISSVLLVGGIIAVVALKRR